MGPNLICDVQVEQAGGLFGGVDWVRFRQSSEVRENAQKSKSEKWSKFVYSNILGTFAVVFFRANSEMALNGLWYLTLLDFPRKKNRSAVPIQTHACPKSRERKNEGYSLPMYRLERGLQKKLILQ